MSFIAAAHRGFALLHGDANVCDRAARSRDVELRRSLGPRTLPLCGGFHYVDDADGDDGDDSPV